MNHADVVVVGSGASGAHAAWPLVESGLRVVMVDIGLEDDRYAGRVPERPFEDLRRHDPNQHRYMLGDSFEGVPLGAVGSGPQVTPPRQYVFSRARELFPEVAIGFEPLQSVALGGLAQAWGAGCFSFLDDELRRAGLDPEEMRKHYDRVARRIGVSGALDDLDPCFGRLERLMPPLDIDTNASLILQRYESRREWFQRRGIRVGRPTMAVVTEPLEDRRPQPYHDLDFWSNAGNSVYRPAITIAALVGRQNFHLRRPRIVDSFSEEQGWVRIKLRTLDGGIEELRARSLVLAAGALGTARIVLRSLGQFDRRVPLTCNPHAYVPTLLWRALGVRQNSRRHSLAQLSMVYDADETRTALVQSQMFSYGSLLISRLLRESPLPYKESIRIMSALAPAIAIWLIQHGDEMSETKTCRLRRRRGDADYLEIDFVESPRERERVKAGERSILNAIRTLGCIPLKVAHPPPGASVHYASTIPFSASDDPLTSEPDGRLRGARAVYIADGAAFRYLPAKGLTFTLMANADRIGLKLADRLRAQD